jgi:NitT/TauT family transport system substrate-binding protein
MRIWLSLFLIVACLPEVCRAQSLPEADDSAPRIVRLGYFANVTHAQAVLGVASGDYAAAAAPSKLTTRTYNAGPALIESLFAGEIDIGYIGPGPALNAHLKSRGQGVRIVAGSACDGVAVIARQGSGIRTLQDLRAKRIATPQMGNTQDLSARHYMIHTLGQPDANNILPVPNAELAAMMSRGRIDAAWAVEPWASRLVAEAGGVLIAEESDLWEGGTFGLTVVIASREFVEREPELLKRLLGAHVDWTRRLAEDSVPHAPAMADAIERLTGKRLSPELLRNAMERVRFDFSVPTESLETFARWSTELGFTRAMPNAATIVDDRALRAVIEARPEQQGATPALIEPVAAR